MSQPISPNELKRLFPSASAATLARNGVGQLQEPQPQSNAIPEPRGKDASKTKSPSRMERSTASKRRVVITLTRYGRRLLDDDNLAGGLKHLRDSIAASMGIDDGDPRLRWCYGQVRTDGGDGVLVLVDVV